MTSPGQGFQGLQQGLSGVIQQADQQSKSFIDGVASGQLQVNPDALDAAAKHCEDHAHQVRELQDLASQLGQVDFLGDYHVSQGLADHFQKKATDSQSGATGLLKQLYQEMMNQANAFRQAAKDYRDREAQIAHNLGKAGQ